MTPPPLPPLRSTPGDLRRDRWFLLAILLWLLLPAVIRPLGVPDEGRYAEIARWMTVSGDWLVPRENGLPFFHKPPLLYWLDAGFITLFGAQPWVARLAPVLAGFATCAGLFWFARRRLGSAAARLASAILATSLLVFGSSQYVNHDMLVACWISLALLGFIEALVSGERAPLFLAYVACALGFLSKGLIGVALPGLVLLPWLLVSGRWRQLGFLLDPRGILLFLTLVLPWFALVQHRYPGFFHYFFIEQQFDRYTTGNFNNKQPWWFYPLLLPLLFLPWPLLAARRGAWRDARQALGAELAGLLAWWVAAITLFFSIPQSKLVGYILPAAAPLALLLAAALLRRQGGRLQRGLVAGLSVLAGAGIALGLRRHGGLAPADLAVAQAIGVALLLAGLALGAQMWRAADARPGTLLLAAACALALVGVAAVADRKNNSRDLAVANWLTPGTQLVFYRTYWLDLPFLLQVRAPVPVVNDWAGVRSDTWAMEQREGSRFDPAAAAVLWEEADFRRALAGQRPLLVLAAPSVTPPGLEAMAPVYRGHNFQAWRVSGRPSAGSAGMSSPPPAPAQ